jgi:hypothetical protein
MQQICCSYFSTSIASVWTVMTRCFLSSSNTGKNQTCLIFCPISGNSITSLPAVCQSPLLLKNEQQPISALLFALVLFFIIVILLLLLCVLLLLTYLATLRMAAIFATGVTDVEARYGVAKAVNDSHIPDTISSGMS